MHAELCRSIIKKKEKEREIEGIETQQFGWVSIQRVRQIFKPQDVWLQPLSYFTFNWSISSVASVSWSVGVSQFFKSDGCANVRLSSLNLDQQFIAFKHPD